MEIKEADELIFHYSAVEGQHVLTGFRKQIELQQVSDGKRSPQQQDQPQHRNCCVRT